MNWFGLAHIVSLLYLTGVVAFVVGLQESPEERPSDDRDKSVQPIANFGEEFFKSAATRHVLGCWGKMLGSLVGLGLIVYILSLFAN